MDKLREFLTRRIAGVPVIALVALAAAVLLFFAMRMRNTAADTVDTNATDAEPGGDADPFGGDSGNPTFEASPSSSTVIAVPTTDTNELWGGRAREYLMHTMGQSATSAQALVYKYLNSQALNTTEQAQINNVVSVLGYPPEVPDPPDVEDPVTDPNTDPVTTNPPTEPPEGGTGGGTGANMPPTKQGTPPCMHTIRNARDNGPGELGVLYFGNNNPNTVNKIEAANLDIGSGPWTPGTRVKIPENVTPHYFTATANVKGLNEIAAKNGVTKEYVKALNPGMDFPVAVGARVRVR